MRPDGWTPLYLRSIEHLTAVGAAGGRGAGSGVNAAAAAAASVSGEYGVAKYPWGVMSKHIAGLKVAGGTGITPMLQVLEKALADPADATKFALLFGNVTPDDILLKGRLGARARRTGRFAVEYYVDAPPSWWRGGRGYVDKKAIARFLPAATQKTKILVCGPPGLVKMVAGEKVSFKDQGPVGATSRTWASPGTRCHKF
ncbi:flavoprotein pyridine nucleotide cytochrome reductase [Aureococcus anophagefferens]|uniref:Flavoprotein pyridine nucleotide cytochrome reductase n=1 Tax=Aureococcus anophagefferens TaxID=44056 RepID=A0ABR1G6P7_AURAN